MDELRWLEWVRAELARRRLPADYCRRLLIELSDHLHTFTEDLGMDAVDPQSLFHRMGQPSVIAETAQREFRKTRFALRHPLFTFILGPVLCLVLFYVAEFLGLWAVVTSASWFVDDAWPERNAAWFDPMLPTIVYLIAIVPIAAAAAFFCRLAFRCDCPRRWPAVACLVIALLSAFYFSDVAMPSSGNRGLLHGSRVISSDRSQENKHKVFFGAGINRRPSVFQMLQVAIPLSICGWAIYRDSRRQRQTTGGLGHAG